MKGDFSLLRFLERLKFSGFLSAKGLDKTDQFSDSCSATLPSSECQGFLERKNFQITTHCSNIMIKIFHTVIQSILQSLNKYFQSRV